MKQDLTRIGQLVAKVFSKKSKHYRELGLDIAVTPNKKPYILEVNTRPQFYPLKHFKNKDMYNNIMDFAKQYGREK